ncbi:protein PAT1 homolog [Euphorbia lathyris]|uniref:protein PAT1 homolog n=1 Tax=Euphorbia lathyris TaxID=212925 RepID=UPI003313C817
MESGIFTQAAGDSSTDSLLFDASQYAFFGNDHVQEVELGDLEEEEEEFPGAEFDEEEVLIGGQEGEAVRSLSGIDDLAHTFSKLNKDVGQPINEGTINYGETREFSSTGQWAPHPNAPNWLDQQRLINFGGIEDAQRRSMPPYTSQRTSYLEQPEHHGRFSSEPIPVPKSSFASYPPPGEQSSPNKSHLDVPYLGGGSQMAIPSPNLSPFSSQFQLTSLRHGSPHFGGNASQYPVGLSPNNQSPNQWVNRMGLYPGDYPNRSSNMLQQQPPHQNGLMPPHLLPHQQHRLQYPVQPQLRHLSSMESQLLNPHLSASPPMMSKFEAVLGPGDVRDQRPRGAVNGRENWQYSQQGFDMYGQRFNSARHRFRSKYMTAYELEGIHRAQLAAVHTSDPYVEDYYNQACLAKKSSGAQLKHHFCPIHVRDIPPHARANTEPHAFLQVDALGRVPFSSIRRPRPLLEVDPPNVSNSDVTDQKVPQKPLDQEPLLAARVAIEDGFCLLLDVDDIDRFLVFNQHQDGGGQLRRRRQVLLEDLATSLQLVDPLGNNGHGVGLAPNDDLVFLRLVSLPKGRKLLAWYLQRLPPGSDILRIVCMAIFRHLRILFGDLPSDPRTVEATNILARVVSSCARRMDVVSLSACLAAVVCSSEQPLLRPLGSFAGNGASLILISVLERAAELLSQHNSPNQSIWKASFDQFFGLLMKYCMNKYDSIMQSSLPDPSEAIKDELPMELLRASIPHTNDFQKKMLFDLSQRSIVGQDGDNGNCTNTVLVKS